MKNHFESRSDGLGVGEAAVKEAETWGRCGTGRSRCVLWEWGDGEQLRTLKECLFIAVEDYHLRTKPKSYRHSGCDGLSSR